MQEGKDAINALERALKLKEGNFKIDAVTVTRQIQDLQSSLLEKVEEAERVSRALACSVSLTTRLWLMTIGWLVAWLTD